MLNQTLAAEILIILQNVCVGQAVFKTSKEGQKSIENEARGQNDYQDQLTSN
ncbi:unnamed protein product, partial [Ceratitis capitata]